MILSYELLNRIGTEYGQSFYLLDSQKFADNFDGLKAAFSRIYPHFNIAYSYKTNYIPKICRIADELGGYAEVVSDMEYAIARKIGVAPEHIIFNGPYKTKETVEALLTGGGIVNIDSAYELEILDDILKRYSHPQFNVGIRCNFSVNDRVSRFGFDIESAEFMDALKFFRERNLHLKGLHCHLKGRDINTWAAKTDRMIGLVDELMRIGILPEMPDYIDIGGGMSGKANNYGKDQTDRLPTYEEYANVIATRFRERYGLHHCPLLLIEPGTALAANVMKFAAKAINIKRIHGKPIATLLASVYNINPTHKNANPPITVYHNQNCGSESQYYKDMDFGGYTCMEDDLLFRGYEGRLYAGDYVVFENVGAYTVVLKPPFILPDFAIIEYNEASGYPELIKKRENFETLFTPYF